MIDIHCHILHGVDDGAKTMEDSLEMARIAYADGIRTIVATPHFAASLLVHKSTVIHKTNELQVALNNADIPVRILPGNEVRLESADFIYDHAKNERFCYLDPDQKFILLEMRWASYNPDTPEVVRWFLDRGTTPIIPHPERHTFFRKKPKLLSNLVEAGAWTQVSVDSLLGKNTVEAEEFACWMLDNDYVHTLATDAHNVLRKPNLSLGFNLIAQLRGEKRAEEIRERLNIIVGQ